MKSIQLKEYSIHITNEFAGQNFSAFISNGKYSNIIILDDEHTHHFCLPVLEKQISGFHLITIPAGEQFKTIDTCSEIWQNFIDAGIDRKSLLINLGGGVIGDMGGFTAGTFKRGFDFINIPTTLLSQVDASVGGKLGVDFNGIKNLIGLFQNPNAIFISTEFLHTLPFEQLRSGFAEILKHGLIADKSYWDLCKSIHLTKHRTWLPIVERSVELKKQVVEQDPFESGLRKILNFGHTIGHAVETIALQDEKTSLLHGEAIAVGMICEAYLSNAVCGLSKEELKDIVDHISNHFPKQDISGFDFNALLKLMQQDKKNEGGKINFSLLKEIGNCTYDIQADEKLIEEALKFYIGL